MIIRRVGYRELRYPPTTECWACITVAQNSSTRGAQTIHPSKPKRRMQTLFLKHFLKEQRTTRARAAAFQ